jgi:acyl-CoA synthetase (AMP-forming)/AMP-acid ligase II
MEVLAKRFGKLFTEMGVVPGEYVGVCLMNSAEFLAIWLGLLSIGASAFSYLMDLATRFYDFLD